MAENEVKQVELKIWNDLLEHEARRENAADHWHGELSGHAKALQRLGVIDEDELRELNELADAAYESVRDQIDEDVHRQDAGGGDIALRNSTLINGALRETSPKRNRK